MEIGVLSILSFVFFVYAIGVGGIITWVWFEFSLYSSAFCFWIQLVFWPFLYVTWIIISSSHRMLKDIYRRINRSNKIFLNCVVDHCKLRRILPRRTRVGNATPALESIRFFYWGPLWKDDCRFDELLLHRNLAVCQPNNTTCTGRGEPQSSPSLLLKKHSTDITNPDTRPGCKRCTQVREISGE